MSSYQADSAALDRSSDASEALYYAQTESAPPTGELEWDPEALGQALLNDESQADWSAVTNLDAFFCRVYLYFVEKGFWCIIAARLTNLLTLAFTICFSTFLMLFIDWHSLLFCNSADCSDVIGVRSGVWTSPSKGEVLVFMYFGVFAVYWLWSAVSFVDTLRDAVEMRAFYRDDLQILDDDLVSLEWHYILDSLVQVSKSKKLCIVKDLTALDITNRIMRKDNYMIAMINLDIFQFGPRNAQGVWNVANNCCGLQNESKRRQKGHELQETRKTLRERGSGKAGAAAAPSNPLTSPPPARALQNPLLSDARPDSLHVHVPATHPASSYSTFNSPTAVTVLPASRLPPPVANASAYSSWWSWAIMGTTLEWNLRFAVLNSLFDSHFYVHSSYLGSAGINALKMRFIVLGVANLLLSPFIMLFMIIFFFLKHAEELHSKKTLFGPRQWCYLAQWKLREFNELPHFFERRLMLSSVAAHQYMQQFPNTLVSIIAQSVAYISGALVACLLILTVTDSDIITHRIFERSLLWYLAVFSGVLALSRSMVPDKSIYPAPALVMTEVCKHTHYNPPHWRHRTHTSAVHQEFSYMYPSRLSMFCYEVMSVVMTPIVLIFCMPNCAERIVQFVSTRTVNVQGVGHLCSYAMFDLEKHGDTRYSHIQTVNFSAPSSAPNLTPQTSGEHKDAGQRATGSSLSTPSALHRQTSSGTAPPPFPLRLKHGKIEKSFLNFAMANPHWKAAEADGASGAKFLASLADTMYGRAEGSPQLSREVSGDVQATPRKFRAAASVRFGGAAAASTRLPPVSAPMSRQDSLDSTSDEPFDEDTAAATDADQQQAEGSKSSASYLLSQSDRHLIQSFADLIGLEAGMQSSLHPSSMMRQSSMGSVMGMSTMLGLNHRRGPQPSPQQQRANMQRSQMGASLYHPANSVLLNSSLQPRGGGGLQGGLSASSLLQMNGQSLREQLMLAQADQQADMFALLESRLDDGPLEEGEETEENEDEPPQQQQQQQQRAPKVVVAHTAPSFESQASYSQPTPPPRSGHATQPAHPASAPSTASAISSASPPQHYASSLESQAEDDNEPPPSSFFN